MDEAWAGGTGDSQHKAENKVNYLFKNNWYWSVSPRYYNSSRIFNVSYGYLDSDGVVNTNGSAASVISLTPEYFSTLIGDGSMESPFSEA